MESQPISEESLALITEKRRLRRQYSQAHNPLVKTRMNQLQKEIKDNLRIESQGSWEKFCNHISLETNHTESWRKIKTSQGLVSKKWDTACPPYYKSINKVSGQFSNMAPFRP